MQFNIKNDKNFNKLQSKLTIKSNDFELVNDLTNLNNLTLLEIINELNSSDLLNIKSKREVSIIFEDFTWLGKIKNKLNNFISKTLDKENLENSIAHYNSKSKSIHIFDGIIEPKSNNNQFKKSYNYLINTTSNIGFVINFFVLHEIGHAIYDEVINHKKNNNFTDYFKLEFNNSIHKQQNTILHENFADMFAAIAYLTIDKNNPNLVKDLELFSQFRKDITQQPYYTFNNLDKIINDYKSNNLNFASNEELLEYINENTNNEIKIRLKESLESTLNLQQHNKQLSYLSHLFKLEDKSFTGIISYLEKEINYVKPLGVSYESEFFQNNSPNSEMNKIAQRIKKFSVNFKSEMNSPSNKIKH